MHFVDIGIIVLYMGAMLGIGFFFMRRNETGADYYVAGRDRGSFQIGLSVVATDVGGGFSIGLGGLGFLMGLSGSWMLFTGLLGAWISGVVLIPHVKKLSNRQFLTFPQLFEHHYGSAVALLAGIISAVGYLGFTSSQMLAGAKLATATFGGIDLQTALLGMGVIIVVYTVLGGLRAVIFTDVLQWSVLMVGLIGVGLPFGYVAIGGIEEIRAVLPAEFFSFSNVGWQTLVNWGVTIIPVWFVGMTLYQRIYASRDVKVARRAWFLAGLFEWPVMAFMGVLLGLFARVAAEQGMFAFLGYDDVGSMDAEMGVPLLLRAVLPVGLMGIMMAAYLSAIMSTADSCLMAASGNVITDIFGRFGWIDETGPRFVRVSQVVTLVLGSAALILASAMENVLELMLHSYAFLVSGLFIPVIGALFLPRPSAPAAFVAMLGGGSTTLILMLLDGLVLTLPLGLDANIFGISISLVLYLSVWSVSMKTRKPVEG